MIPGTTSKLSESDVWAAAKIEAKSDIVYLLGTVSVKTIIPHFHGASGLLFLIAATGNTILLPYTPAVPGVSPQVGNILIGATLPVNTIVALVYNKRWGLWTIAKGALDA